MVEIKNLSLSYDKKEQVLNNISLKINEGDFVLLTGKSGSGKSSIINAINGLAKRYDNAIISGKILIGGNNIDELKLYEISMLVSTVFQNPKTYFFNINTTLELLFFLENIGCDKKEMDVRMKEMLKAFPIKKLLNRDIFKLSGGERQILSIAASYIAGTKIIVLDEPSSNLDAKNIEILRQMLLILKKKKITLIISEHRIYYLMELVDKVYLISDGQIKNSYSIEDLKKISLDKLNDLGLRDKDKTKLKVPLNNNKGTFYIKYLEYNFKIPNKKLILRDISFDTKKIYGIIGDNGHGKTTLLKILIGIEKNSKEEIFYEGRKLSKKERLKLSSLVMQDVNHQLFTDNVCKELTFGLKSSNQKKAETILKELNLYQFKERHPMSLSGGQKQRVAIASIICQNSKFLFFDEPTSGMDYANMLRISKLIKNCKNKNKIIFVVSHDIEFLNETADYVLKV